MTNCIKLCDIYFGFKMHLKAYLHNTFTYFGKCFEMEAQSFIREYIMLCCAEEARLIQ